MASYEKAGKQLSNDVVRILDDYIEKEAGLQRLKEGLFFETQIRVRSLLFRCRHCNQESMIGDLTFIQDKTRDSHGFEVNIEPGLCRVQCPLCKKTMYLPDHPRRDDILACIEALRPFGIDAVFTNNERGQKSRYG